MFGGDPAITSLAGVFLHTRAIHAGGEYGEVRNTAGSLSTEQHYPTPLLVNMRPLSSKHPLYKEFIWTNHYQTFYSS